MLRIVGARHNNLKNIDVQIPLGTVTAVTGVSGSGKSSLVEDVLYNQLARSLHRAGTNAGAHDRLEGVEQIDKVIRVDQRPLGNTPSSNPATCSADSVPPDPTPLQVRMRPRHVSWVKGCRWS